MWSARAYEDKKMCLGVKHEKSAKDRTRWLPNALSLWELDSCGSPECLKPWLEKQTSTKLGPQDTIRKFLMCRCLKCLHIVHLDLIAWIMIKWKSGSQILNFTNPLRVGVKWSLIGACNTLLERTFWGLKDNALTCSKQAWFEKNMNIQSFWTTKVPILGVSRKSVIWM